MYSQYCGNLAAKGWIVLSLEHRDGSSPTTTIKVDGTERTVDYLQFSDITWAEGDQPQDSMHLRRIQLELRIAEVTEALKHMKSLAAKTPFASSAMRELTNRDIDWTLWEQIDVDSPIIAGHSFGGATSLLVASKELPFSKCIALDPWCEPLDDGLRTRIPTLTINSEGFTLWSSHFAKLKRIVNAPEQNHLLTIGEVSFDSGIYADILNNSWCFTSFFF